MKCFILNFLFLSLCLLGYANMFLWNMSICLIDDATWSNSFYLLNRFQNSKANNFFCQEFHLYLQIIILPLSLSAWITFWRFNCCCFKNHAWKKSAFLTSNSQYSTWYLSLYMIMDVCKKSFAMNSKKLYKIGV